MMNPEDRSRPTGRLGLRRGWRLSLVALAATIASAAQAHDFFLMPDQFSPSRPGARTILATVGSSFPRPEIVVTADRVEQVYARGAGSPRLQIGAAGANALALRLTGARRGMVVAAVRAKDRDVEYAEDRIPLILGEYRVSPEAQAAVAALPAPRTLRVVSRRFAKTIMCVQTCGNRAEAAQPVGVDLEFVGRGSAGDHFQLLRMGRPLANYPVDLVSSAGERRHLQTDADGVVHLPSDARGRMMLFAAAMTPPAGAERFTLDLSTLTFSRS